MSTMLADVRGGARSRASIKGVCNDGFLDDSCTKLKLSSVPTVAAGVMAVMALARLANLWVGGAPF